MNNRMNVVASALVLCAGLHAVDTNATVMNSTIDAGVLNTTVNASMNANSSFMDVAAQTISDLGSKISAAMPAMSNNTMAYKNCLPFVGNATECPLFDANYAATMKADSERFVLWAAGIAAVTAVVAKLYYKKSVAQTENAALKKSLVTQQQYSADQEAKARKIQAAVRRFLANKRAQQARLLRTQQARQLPVRIY